ncbi:MAG: TonB-dependent receptor [candidate division KSB1 bacterium]|nr:TonB-dependent receptor [candidate division KSB1 bacterium]
MKKWFCCSIFLLICNPIFSQMPTNGSISGFVYDDQTGEQLIGANVFLQQTNFGAATNRNGFYSIPKIPSGNYVLVCQFIGYKTFSQPILISANARLTINIHLKPTVLETSEVLVVADSVRTSVQLFQKPISKIELSPRQIDRIPQVAEADLLRSLQSLPGIVAISDFSSELYVRGGLPDQNLYLIDGADVYNPEHFFGLFSTFNTDAIKAVEISRGGFGAEYGGRLSSVLEVTNLDGNRREFQGKVGVSLLSAKTTLQFPLGKIGSLSGSFRRTYFDKTIGRTMEDIPDYYFYDGHLKAYFDINASNKLTISTYNGQDDLNFDFENQTDDDQRLKYIWGNSTASIRWTHIFSPALFSNFWITGSRFQSDFRFELIKEKNQMEDLTFKGHLEYYYSKSWLTKLGVELKNLRGSLYQEFPGGTVDVVRKGKHVSSFVQTVWRPTVFWELQAGLRDDFFVCSRRFNDLAPRLSLKYRLTETVNLKAAAGLYHQYLFRIPRTFFVDIWNNADEFYDRSSARHIIVGFQKEILHDLALEIEAYHKKYFNVYTLSYFFYADLQPKYFDSNGKPIYKDAEGLFDQGTGHSMGLELLVKKERGPITGWLACALGRTEYQIDGVNQNQPFVPRHDRTITFNLIGTMDIRNAWRQWQGRQLHQDRTRWQLGLGLVYASGQPITTTSSIYFTNPLPDQDYYRGYNIYPTAQNSFRLPAYARFDLSLTMERKYRHFTLAPYFQIFNMGNRKNVWFIQYQDEIIDNKKVVQTLDAVTMFPILPTLGVNILF